MCDRRSRLSGSTVWYSSSIPSVNVGFIAASRAARREVTPAEVQLVYQRAPVTRTLLSARSRVHHDLRRDGRPRPSECERYSLCFLFLSAFARPPMAGINQNG